MYPLAMTWTLDALSEMIDAAVEGDPTLVVTHLRPLEEATPTAISPLFRKELLDPDSALPAAVLTHPRLLDTVLAAGIRGVLVHRHPEWALIDLIDLFYPPAPSPVGTHPSAEVHPLADVHPSAAIGALAVVESDVRIGAHSVIGPRAVICSGTVIGERVCIGPGAVIGHEGFGFLPNEDLPRKVRQMGNVVIEDDVEIGANSCVDRGTLGATRIGRGAKIDNLVQVGHNGQIGQRVLIAGQAGLAGSVVVGDDALIGGNAGLADHVHVGAGAKIAAKSGVIGNVPPGAIFAGYPAMERTRWLRTIGSAAREIHKKKKQR